MARIEKADRGLGARLDEIEQKMFVLKIDYEKYFSGLERVEPLRAREELRRAMRDFLDEPIRNSVQRFRYLTLKSRFQSLELYWQRNLTLMERGTHPKMRFRADAKERARAPEQAEPSLSAEQQEVLRQRQEAQEREERAYKLVYDKYLEARARCGQSTDLSFDAVRDALKKQVRTIKSTYQCESVRFRVVVEDGKAKVKAVPQGAATAG